MTSRRHGLGASLLVRVIASLLVLACSGPRPQLKPVPMPDVSALEPSVRAAVTRAQVELTRIESGKPTELELANAYGDLAMTYHAQLLVSPAEAAYSNARALAPHDKRWPYLIGHLYNDASEVPQALAAFEDAFAIDGNDPAIAFSLGEAYLQHGDLDKAEPLYERLQSIDGARAAGLAGLGKVALAKRQYKEAAAYFEEALKLWPTATRLRQPLAMAYRGVGDREKATQNLSLFSASGTEPEIADPMADALGAKVASPTALIRRGERFSRAGRFDLAEPAFSAAVAADPANAVAIEHLGIVLANLGQLDSAKQRLEESLAIDDRNAFAHLSLGVVMDRQGQDGRAIEQYLSALQREPGNVQAMVYLADAKMRQSLPDEAAHLYRQAIEVAPNATHLRLALAMANIKASHYADARAILEEALKSHPDDAEITDALARLLASAPVLAVRDGARALKLCNALFKTTKNTEVGQTCAMAFAEAGHFEQAVALQKESISAFETNQDRSRTAFLQRNLVLYEQRKPAREGWPADDPVFAPRSPATRLAKRN